MLEKLVQEELRHGTEEAQRGADRHPATDRSRTGQPQEHRPSLQRGRDQSTTYYRWRKEYGGLKLEQARRLKELEKENGRLRRL
jgi:hypothetical protein